MAKVLVAIEGGPTAESGSDGRFVFERLQPGTIRLYVSAVGYGLYQRTIDLPAGADLELRIPLSEGAGTYTEEVTVKADRFARPDAGVSSQQVLGAAELQNLRGVLADDALRAVQVLPGVATGDDFRSEFSVRGSDFSHTNFTVDGFATPFLMHMVRAVEERANTGSVAMINSDVLEQVVLSNGGYVQRSGNRTGPELAFTIREGSRERQVLRASVSGTSASVTAEGPLGRSRRGSWLVSGRKSYLDLIIDRLREEGLSFGFIDAQAKLRYDLSASQSVALTVLAGDSRLEELPEDENDTGFIGNNGSAIAMAGWRRSLRRGLLTAGTMVASNGFRNHTNRGVDLEDGATTQVAGRLDLALRFGRGLELESGLLAEHIGERQHKRRPAGPLATETLNEYREEGTRTGVYVKGRVNPVARLALLPGIRADRWSLTQQSTLSPWLQIEWPLRDSLVLRGATGLYQQFPDFEKTAGAYGGTAVRPERSLHSDLGIERRLSEGTRMAITLYNRTDENVIRRPDAEPRLVGGRFVPGSSSAPYANRLDGYARGVEVLVQRRAADGFTGWLSYSYGRNRYEDPVREETFWGDLDQRHTVNAYGAYRFSHRTSAGAKFRMGTNFPIPGYFARQGETYVLSGQRNALRLPSYARLDVRVNRTFDWSRRRLTLFAEVINVLNRDNVRYSPPRINSATHRVTSLFDSLIPVVPSAGVLLEF